MSNLIKVDLHVHSDSSYDCCTTIEEFRYAFDQGVINRIAITDHSVIELAFELKTLFGDKIIVGEEVMTSGGEIIGLFLTKQIPKLLTPEKTIEEIRKQGGVVYIPHPFDLNRSGIGRYEHADKIMEMADIVEVFNSRCFTQTPNEKAHEYAEMHDCIVSAASDAHDWKDIGTSFVELEDFATAEEFLVSMKKAVLHKHKMAMTGFLTPARNKLYKKLNGYGYPFDK
jgi:predicted metal-dependent phosphoesterase TrpH